MQILARGRGGGLEMQRTTTPSIGLLCGAVVVSGPLQAAGFAVIEQSVKGLGTAFASGAAGGEDASTVFFNPAVMTKLSGDQLLGGSHVIIPNVDFRNKGSQTNPALGGAPLRGIEPNNGGEVGFVPNFYYMHSFSDNLKYGVGINTPFALGTTYNLGWVGRYHADRSELMTINFNPSVAYRINPMLSVGAGFNLQYLDVTLTNALDASAICLGATRLGRIPGGACQQAGLATPGNPGTDGFSKLIGNSVGFGYNLGLLFEPLPTTRIGLQYRSDVDQEAEGDATFTMPNLLKLGGAFHDTTATAPLTLPATASISAFHELNPEWSIMGDVTWTHWSTFQQLRVQFDNPAQPTSITPERWDNSFRYSLGGTYHPSGKPYVFRMGVALDETPIPSAALRSPRIPDADRKWLAFGGSYQVSKTISVDAAYTHLFLDDAPINNTEPATGHRLAGEFGLDIDIFSVQLAWKML
jgi:long-chain fatty acid transport protein